MVGREVEGGEKEKRSHTTSAVPTGGAQALEWRMLGREGSRD
jgi:hypothetical protein